MFDNHLALPGAFLEPELWWLDMQTLVVTVFNHPFAEIPLVSKPSYPLNGEHF